MEGEALLCELPELEPEQEEGRLVCAACERPAPTCWCPHLPLPRPSTNTRVLIFQHPAELRRGIRTARMLELGLAPGCCTTVTARRFPGDSEELAATLASPSTSLLYPGPGSRDLASLASDSVKTLVILDGTWDQARKLYSRNPALQQLARVTVTAGPSQYLVRTQPRPGCLSTLEAGAHSLAALEGRPELVPALLAPLTAMCNTQAVLATPRVRVRWGELIGIFMNAQAILVLKLPCGKRNSLGIILLLVLL